jgi:stress-induced morphogen
MYSAVGVEKMSLQTLMEKKIHEALEPLHWELINESHMHSVAPGSETHFKLVVVSSKFEGLNRVKRHRLLYDLFASELKAGVHALSLQAHTPAEWKLKQAKKIRRVLFLADRNVLRDQAFNTFEPFGNARGYIEEGQAPTARDIYFSIYQAMWSEKDGKRIFEQYPKDFFDLIVIDECHRSGYWI